MTAVVSLGAVFINLASDTSDAQSFQNTTGLKATTSKDGTVRKLAGGRMRAVTRTGTRRLFELELELCDRTQIEWLETNVGSLVCVRDDRGRKVWATYFDVPVTENVARADYGNVTLSLYETTHPEDV